MAGTDEALPFDWPRSEVVMQGEPLLSFREFLAVRRSPWQRVLEVPRGRDEDQEVGVAATKQKGRGEPSGSLTGADREPLDATAVPAQLWVDALDAVIDAEAFLSVSAYDGGRTVRVALQVRGARFDEYARDVQHLAALLEAVTAKCMGVEPMGRASSAAK